MVEITVPDVDAQIVGTNSADIFTYNPLGASEEVSQSAPDGLSINGRGGVDTLDFVSLDEGALLNASLDAMYNAATNVTTFAGSNTLTSIEKILFENGELDLSDPTSVAGQYFVDKVTFQTVEEEDTVTTWDRVDNIFVTVEDPDSTGVFTVAAVTDDGGLWDYASINGQSIGIGGVQLDQGTFSVNNSGGLEFTVSNAYRDSLDAGTEEDLAVTVLLEQGELDDVESTYTVTINAASELPFAFTEDADTATRADFTASVLGSLSGIVSDNGARALGGDDRVTGGDGTDLVFGGAGNDRIFAGPEDDSADIFIGGAGDDRIGGSVGNDFLVGDSIYGTTGFNSNIDFGASGDDGKDQIFGGAGNDQIITGSVTDDDDSVFLSGDVDNVLLNVGEFRIVGTANDIAYGGAGMDTIWGAGGNDVIGGGADDDTINGGAGNDTLYGGAGATSGNDLMNGGAGADIIYGGAGTDRLNGGIGGDELYGGSEADILRGDDGDDLIDGGTGNDTLTGGSGADTFVFKAGDGNDSITDFTQGAGDQIDLSAFNIEFTDLDDLTYEVEGTAFIALDADTTLEISGVELADLVETDFIF